MSRPAQEFDSRPPILMWVSAALSLLGAIWCLMLFREYYIAVKWSDATGTSEAEFYSTQNGISFAIAVLSMAIGLIVFRQTVQSKRRARRYSDRYHHHSHRRKGSMPQVATNSVPATSADDAVSFDLEKASSEPKQGGGAEASLGRRVRVKQRVRIKIRKKDS